MPSNAATATVAPATVDAPHKTFSSTDRSFQTRRADTRLEPTGDDDDHDHGGDRDFRQNRSAIRDDLRHQITIYSHLVKGVYNLQYDHKRHRGLEPRWWEFNGFKLSEKLHDKSIFGAVYEKDSQYVIAFRGTMKGRHEIFRDMNLNLSILTNKLAWKSRFETAIRVVEEKVAKFGGDNVFLAGHSLGAAIAMLAGKYMVIEKGIFLETFLFNPPYITAIMLLSENKFRKLKKVIRWTKTILHVTGNILITCPEEKEKEEMFKKLSGWKPNLCVHEKDLICSEYQSYFNDMKKLVENGMENIAHTAARVSTIHLLRKFMGKKSDIPLHLLPSAKLIINQAPEGTFDAHKLQQWWKPNLQFHSQEFSLYDLSSGHGN